MNVTNIINVSKTIEEYNRAGGRKTTLPEIIKDIRNHYSTHPEWILTINQFMNPESENKNTPLCDAYDKVKDLFTKGFPSFKLIDIPIPEVTVAKAIQVANDTIDEGGPIMSELGINTLKLQNSIIEKKLKELDNSDEPEPNNPESNPDEPNHESNPDESDLKKNDSVTKGGSIYFTKEDCTF